MDFRDIFQRDSQKYKCQFLRNISRGTFTDISKDFLLVILLAILFEIKIFKDSTSYGRGFSKMCKCEFQ